MWVSARYRIVLASRLHRRGDPQLRQNYITPYCIKCMASHSQARLCPCTALRPSGLRSRRYAKLPTLVRACQPSALPSRFASDMQSSVALVVCWCCGIYQALCAWFQLAAPPCILFVPRPPLGLASQHRPRGLPVRPQGAPSEPRVLDVYPCFYYR